MNTLSGIILGVSVYFEKAKDQTFKGIPNKKEIPNLCGSCHSDSLYMRNYNPTIRVDQLELY